MEVSSNQVKRVSQSWGYGFPTTFLRKPSLHVLAFSTKIATILLIQSFAITRCLKEIKIPHNKKVILS